MSLSQDQPGRAVVTCDGCGTPYAAVIDDDGELALLGMEGNRCRECGGAGFARVSLSSGP